VQVVLRSEVEPRSLVSSVVGRRVPEFGLRAALGATPGALLRMLLQQATSLALLGTLLGAVGALLGGRMLESLLFGVDARDPRVFAGSALLLLLVAVSASLLPAARAARRPPLRAFREE
jgi:ABC-type antimicrobial peptide transport system permease subunit